MRLIWREEFRTGIQDIDRQHQALIEIIADLEDLIEKKDAVSSREEIINRLSAYVAFHFETEENLIRSQLKGSDHVALHEQAHDEFAAFLAAFRALADDRQTQQLGKLLGYLKQWLSHHIMLTDMEMARLLSSNQPTTPGKMRSDDLAQRQ